MTSAIVLRTQSDERLSALAAEGSERAFEVIVGRYRRDLLAYCSRLLHSDSRGEEVVQQSLLNAWIALRDGTGVRELKPWLYRIAYNQAISSLRRAGHDVEQFSEISDRSEHEFDRRMELRETLAAVAALPELQRRAIMQTSVRGESYEAAAVTLGVSEKAVRGLVYRARQRVRAAVAAVAPFPLGLWAAQHRRRIGLWQWLGDLLPATASTGGAAIGIKTVAVIASSALIIGGGLVDRTPEHAIVHRSEHSASARTSTASARTLRSVSANADANATPIARAAHPVATGEHLVQTRLRGHQNVAAAPTRGRTLSAKLAVASGTAAATREALRSEPRATRQPAGRAAPARIRSPSPQGSAASGADRADPPDRPSGSAQAPGGSAQAPGGSAQAPGGSAQALGGSAQALGGSGQASGGSTQTGADAGPSPLSVDSAASATSETHPTVPDPGSGAESSQPQPAPAGPAASPQPAGAQTSSPAPAQP